jgi:hypothetical protein
MYETYLLQEIKTRICLRAGIKNVTPADCKYLASEIRKTVHKNVSETTLKRFFGFAAVSHGFSKYTMSAMSEYADFMQPIYFGEKPTTEIPLTDWDRLHKKIGSITDYVLKEIRNRSGLPYEMTISRKFAQHDFEEFYDNPASFMCFIAHPGYGKTILLSHIVQKYFRDVNGLYRDSIVLFINARSFNNSDTFKFNLNIHLKNVFEIPESGDLITFLKTANIRNNKFFLIIDGFSDLILDKESKIQLFNELMDFICSLDNSPNIKIIMSMRSTMWVRFYDKIRHSAYIKSTWFKGNYYNLREVSNVPPFTEDELQEITRNTGNENYSRINPILKSQLKFPFHIQLYYQLRIADPFLNYGSNIAFYELISRFIQEKIFKSNHYTEKLKFIKRLLEITNFGQAHNSVEKNLVIAELITFKSAYMELIADGILFEERRSAGFFPREFISFLHPQIFEYFIFMELFNQFASTIKVENIFEFIHTKYKGNPNRFILLQWGVRHFLKTSDYNCIEAIRKLALNNYERNYLVLFIAENLKYELNINPHKIKEIQAAKVHERIIEGLSNLDYLDSCYFEGIQALIDICDKDQNWVVYHTILSLIDFFSLDAERISKRIEILNPHKELCESSFVNPLEFLQMAYAKSKGEQRSTNHLITKVEHMVSGIDTSTSQKNPDTATAIFYILLLGTNLFYGDATIASQLIGVVYKLHPKLLYSRTPFATYMLLLYGIACAKNKHFKKVLQIRNIISYIAADKEKYGFTLYSESLLIYLEAIIAKAKGNTETAINNLENALEIFRRNQLNVNALIVYNMLIETCQSAGDVGKMNEYKFEKRCFQEENHIPTEIFPYLPAVNK